MTNTYEVNAKCNQVAGINVEFKGISDINTAFECVSNLAGAFPMVDIICEQTGEVVYSRYIATDLFHPITEMGKAIFEAECSISF